MDTNTIKEAILGKEGCRKEETPLAKYSTFEPDMEMVELLLRGADIQKSFNDQPLPWIWQFCKPDLAEMFKMLLRYKYYELHLERRHDFECFLLILEDVPSKYAKYAIRKLKQHNFELSVKQNEIMKENAFKRARSIWVEYWNNDSNL